MKEIYEKYDIGPVHPAMGTSNGQLHEFSKMINAAPADVVVIATRSTCASREDRAAGVPGLLRPGGGGLTDRWSTRSARCSSSGSVQVPSRRQPSPRGAAAASPGAHVDVTASPSERGPRLTRGDGYGARPARSAYSSTGRSASTIVVSLLLQVVEGPERRPLDLHELAQSIGVAIRPHPPAPH